MPPKSTENTDLPPHVTKTKTGAYKYQRRVPKDLQEHLNRRVWDYSLGSDPRPAFQRAFALADKHDAEIIRFASPETREDDRATLETIVQSVLRDPVEAWRTTADVLKEARHLPAKNEHDRLALFAMTAFGDPSHMERNPIAGPSLAARHDPASAPAVTRPADATDALMFDAFKAALDARLAQIAPTQSTDPLRIKALMPAYITAQ